MQGDWCDGAAGGNPGLAGADFICRKDKGEFVYAVSVGLRILDNYVAESMAILLDLE